MTKSLGDPVILLGLLQRDMYKTRKFRFNNSAEPTISDPGWSAAAYRNKFVWELKQGFVMAADQP